MFYSKFWSCSDRAARVCEPLVLHYKFLFVAFHLPANIFKGDKHVIHVLDFKLKKGPPPLGNLADINYL